MTSQEVLLSGNDVSNDDGGAKWEDDVLIVWVKDKTGVWMRIAPFMDWIKERIFKETYPGMEKCFIQKL